MQDTKPSASTVKWTDLQDAKPSDYSAPETSPISYPAISSQKDSTAQEFTWEYRFVRLPASVYGYSKSVVACGLTPASHTPSSSTTPETRFDTVCQLKIEIGRLRDEKSRVERQLLLMRRLLEFVQDASAPSAAALPPAKPADMFSPLPVEKWTP